MADYVDRYSGDRLRELSERIDEIYKQAGEEIDKKLQTFIAKHERRNELKLQQLAREEITKEQYQYWLAGQVFQEKEWRQKLKDVTNTYVNADEVARKLVGQTNLNVFCEAANYTAYDISKHMGFGVSFDLYDQETVRELLEDNPKTLPEWKIDEPKDYEWNERRVQNAIAQGIIQGESIPKIGKRLCGELATSNARKMELFARTAMTGAQNSGRVSRMEEATEKGISVRKKWIATLDSRTRDAHQELDGQTAAPDEAFESILGKILFPGDPTADPANVYNCRCTLGYDYPEYKTEGQRRAYVDPESKRTELVNYMTYNEWKEAISEQQPLSERWFNQAIRRRRRKREQLFAQETYDKNETDRLLQEILSLEDKKERYNQIKGLVKGDNDLAKKLVSDNAEDISNAIDAILKRPEYGLKDGIYSGKTEVHTIKDMGSAGIANWNGDIWIRDDYKHDYGTYIHEHLHMRSVNAIGKSEAYKHCLNTEEGSVQYLTQEICKKANVPYRETYKGQVNALMEIRRITNHNVDEYTFAKRIFDVEPSKRYNYLENEVEKYKKDHPRMREPVKKKLEESMKKLADY